MIFLLSWFFITCIWKENLLTDWKEENFVSLKQLKTRHDFAITIKDENVDSPNGQFKTIQIWIECSSTTAKIWKRWHKLLCRLSVVHFHAFYQFADIFIIDLQETLLHFRFLIFSTIYWLLYIITPYTDYKLNSILTLLKNEAVPTLLFNFAYLPIAVNHLFMVLLFYLFMYQILYTHLCYFLCYFLSCFGHIQDLPVANVQNICA